MSSPPFMPLWIGDFHRKTTYLDARETGAYMLLIMALWTCGGRLPSDQKKLQRVAKCGREWPKVWDAISQYFDDADGFITQARVTEELQKCAAKREVNAHNGARGGRAKALRRNETDLANAKNSLERNASIPESESEKKEERGKPLSRQTAPDDGCFDHFNAVAARVGWPQVQKLTQARRAALSQRINDAGGPAGWREAIDRAALSPLLTGQTSRGWRADFDWLCKAANFTKLMEGNYDPRTTNNVQPISASSKRVDPALEQIARLTGIGAAPGDGRGGVGSPRQEDGPLWMGTRPQ